jgi:hypothetical protein
VTVVVFPILYIPSHVFHIFFYLGCYIISSMFCSCLYLFYEFSPLNIYIFSYTSGGLCCHDNIILVPLLIYSLNIQLTPSDRAITNASYRFTSRFFQHKYKRSVSLFHASFSTTAVLALAINAKITRLCI